MSPKKGKGRREGVGGAIEEGVLVDDTTERQQSWRMKPPSIWCGASSGELSVRRQLRRPVQRQGLARWHTGWADAAARSAAFSWRRLSWATAACMHLLVAQACKSGVVLLVLQSSVIDPDKEEAAAEP